ncbi:hypothetical protein ACOMHN_008273 [Nucella lapillus]
MLVHSVTLMNTSKQLNRALLQYHQHPRRWLNFGRPCLLALLFPPVEKWIQKSPSWVVVTVGMAVALPPVQLWATLPPVQMLVTLLPVQLWVTLPPTHLSGYQSISAGNSVKSWDESGSKETVEQLGRQRLWKIWRRQTGTSGETETVEHLGETETVEHLGETETVEHLGETETGTSGETETVEDLGEDRDCGTAGWRQRLWKIWGKTENVEDLGRHRLWNIWGRQRLWKIWGDKDCGTSGETEIVGHLGKTETVEDLGRQRLWNIWGDRDCGTSGGDSDCRRSGETETVEHLGETETVGHLGETDTGISGGRQ